MEKLADHWIRLWEIGLWEDVEVPQSLLLVGVGTVLLALVIGATARTYFDVFVRTLVLFFCSMAVQLQGQTQVDRFAQRLMGSPVAVSESFARFLSLLIWATIAWGIARWVRKRRLARPDSSGAA
jgi:hypothetical protein